MMGTYKIKIEWPLIPHWIKITEILYYNNHIEVISQRHVFECSNIQAQDYVNTMKRSCRSAVWIFTPFMPYTCLSQRVGRPTKISVSLINQPITVSICVQRAKCVNKVAYWLLSGQVHCLRQTGCLNINFYGMMSTFYFEWIFILSRVRNRYTLAVATDCYIIINIW